MQEVVILTFLIHETDTMTHIEQKIVKFHYFRIHSLQHFQFAKVLIKFIMAKLIITFSIGLCTEFTKYQCEVRWIFHTMEYTLLRQLI